LFETDQYPKWLQQGLARSSEQVGRVHGLEQFKIQIDRSSARSSTPFEVFVVGEGKFGKSSLINTLFGREEVAPTNFVPKTYCFHRFIATEGQESASVITESLDSPEWAEIKNILASDRNPQVEGTGLRYRCDPKTARTILENEESKVGPGRSYRSPIVEIEWGIQSPTPMLPGLKIVDTQGLDQLLASPTQKAHLDWEFQRADAVLWVISAIKVRSEVTEQRMALFGRYRKPTVIVLSQIDKIQPANREKVITEAREIYGKRGAALVPYNASKGALAAIIAGNDTTMRETGYLELREVLQRYLLAKQNIMRHRTVYVTARQSQRDYRNGMMLLRGTSTENLKLYDEALRDFDCVTDSARAKMMHLVEEQRRNIPRDLKPKYETIDYRDSWETVSQKLYLNALTVRLDRFQVDLERAMNGMFEVFMDRLELRKYRIPQLAADGQAARHIEHKRISDIHWSIALPSTTFQLSVGVDFLDTVQLGIYDTIGVLIPSVRDAAAEKRGRLTRDRREQVRKHTETELLKYLKAMEEGYSNRVKDAALRVEKEMNKNIERLGGLEDMKRFCMTIDAQLAKIAVPSALPSLLNQCLRKRGFPKS
jgi:hypothetical protein